MLVLLVLLTAITAKVPWWVLVPGAALLLEPLGSIPVGDGGHAIHGSGLRVPAAPWPCPTPAVRQGVMCPACSVMMLTRHREVVGQRVALVVCGCPGLQVCGCTSDPGEKCWVRRQHAARSTQHAQLPGGLYRGLPGTALHFVCLCKQTPTVYFKSTLVHRLLSHPIKPLPCPEVPAAGMPATARRGGARPGASHRQARRSDSWATQQPGAGSLHGTQL